MRIHKDFTVVAVSFQELLMLSEACGEVLSRISPSPFEVLFSWGTVVRPHNKWVQVRLSENEELWSPLQFDTPDGCGDELWAKLILTNLRNLLWASSRSSQVVKLGDCQLVLEVGD